MSAYLLAMDDAETGQRGYLLTGNRSYLEPYIKGISRSRVLEKKLRDLFPGGSPGSKDLDVLVRLARAKRFELSRTIGLYRRGERSEALQIVESNEGKNVMDQIRRRVRSLQEKKKRELLDARKLLNRRLEHAERDLVATGISLGLLEGFLWRLLVLSMAKKRRSIEMLEQESQLDRLTGLPNRKKLFEFLEEACRRAEKEGRALAVLFVDLDGFKSINDRYGHAAGDQILVEVARRFGSVIRGEDLLARIGGDEFVIGVSGTGESREWVELLAQRLLASFEDPFFDPVGKGVLSCSVGVALFPKDGRSPAELLTSADMAMYQSKRTGKHRVTFYNPGDREAMSAFPRSS
ncbi:MAG: diguanylate cyclase domain-containing protein [Leptospirillia bacterium]